MSTFLPRVRRTLQGFCPDPGKQDQRRALGMDDRFESEVDARHRLAELLREEVRPGDRVEVDGGSYPDLEKAAAAAPVEAGFTFD